MFLIGNRGTDSEYGGLVGLYDIVIVNTEEEAILEVQKRMYLWTFVRSGQRNIDYYGSEGTEVCVRSPAQYYAIENGRVIEREVEKTDVDEDFQSIFLPETEPIYEPDPRGAPWNSKIIGWKFKEDDSDTI